MGEEREEKPKVKARLSRLYEYDYERNVIKLRSRRCPRCGSIMAHHRAPVERWMCGGCHYTEMVKVEATQ